MHDNSPEISRYLDIGSDVLSFYKEEIAGETVNQVSLMAAVNGSSKSEILERLADEAVAAHTNAQEVLRVHKSALDAYLAFSHGWVAFHAVSKRYHVDKLEL